MPSRSSWGNRTRGTGPGEPDHARGGTELGQIPPNELLAGYELRNLADDLVFPRRADGPLLELVMACLGFIWTAMGSAGGGSVLPYSPARKLAIASAVRK